MNPKQLKRVAIALVTVLVLWGLSEILRGGRDEAETTEVLPAFTVETVNGVTIAQTSDTVILERSGDTWTVNGFDVAPSNIEQLFTALSEPSEAELVATNETTHGRLGVDTAGIRLTVNSADGSLASVVFGKRGRQYNTRFVREEGEVRVFRYAGGLTEMVERDVDWWRDKRVVDIVPDSVHRVAVSRGPERYTLTHADSAWQIGNAAADSAAVRRLLDQYAGLEASGFASAAQADSADFTRPDRSVTLFDGAGDTLASLVLDSTSTAFWTRHASGGTIYRILQWKANQMIPAESTLVAEGGS